MLGYSRLGATRQPEPWNAATWQDDLGRPVRARRQVGAGVLHDVVRREHSTCRRGSAPPPLVPDKKVILRPVGNRVFSRVSARPSTDRPTRAANSPAISKAAWAKLFRITRSSNLLLAVALLRLSPILKLCRGTGTTVMVMSFSWNAAKVSEYKKDSACRLSQDPREPRGRLLETASIEIAALRKRRLDLLNAIDGGR